MIKVLGMPDEQTWPEGVRLANEMGFSFTFFVNEMQDAGTSSSPCLETKVSMASPKAIELMNDLLQWNPERRPSANEALQSSYFSSIVSPMVTNHVHTEESRASNSSSGSWEYQSPVPVADHRCFVQTHKTPCFGENSIVVAPGVSQFSYEQPYGTRAV
jgi:serine/threonine protein kinase